MKVVRHDSLARFDPVVVARGMSRGDAAKFAAMKNAELGAMLELADVDDYFIVEDEEE